MMDLIHNPINKKTLILGFGNLDREDDGVAWHILDRLAKKYTSQLDVSPEEVPIHLAPNLDILFLLQLMPELAETLAGYDRVCFVDAHTGAVPNELHIVPLDACFQASPLTHHLTPETLLCLTRDLYHFLPESLLVSVRGYRFQFNTALSARTDHLADQAVDEVCKWIN